MTYMKMLALCCAVVGATMYGMHYQLKEDEVEVDIDCGTYLCKAIAKKPKPSPTVTSRFLPINTAFSPELRHPFLGVGPALTQESMYDFKAMQPAQPSQEEIAVQALRKAALENNIQQIRELLNKHQIVNSIEQGETALHIVARSGNLDIVRLLLAYGADVNITSEKGNSDISRTLFHMTPLHEAAANGHDAIVLAILEKDPGLEIYNDHLETPLHLAIKNGHKSTAKLLLDHGANIKTRSMHNRTALHIAAENNQPECINLLLCYKADIDTKDKNNQTALHIAVVQRHSAFVQQLLAYHPKLDEYDADLMTPLAYALINKDHSLARILLAHGARQDMIVENRQTLLHLVVNNNDIDGVALLLENHCDVNGKEDIVQKTALHYACAKGNRDIAQVLLDHNADVNAIDGDGNAALHIAAEYGDVRMARVLLEHGANPNLFNSSNYTAVHLAARGNNWTIIELLARFQADLNANMNSAGTPLQLASEYLSEMFTLQSVITLIKLGANIHQSTAYCEARTPLGIAAFHGNNRLLQLFLEHSNSEKFADDYLGGLLTAAAQDHPDTMRLLLDHGGYCNGANLLQRLNESILEALDLHHYNVVRTYLDYDIPLPPKFFHAVIASGQLDLVQAMVLQKGADLTERSDTGQLPEQIPTTPKIRAYLTSTAPYTQRLVQAIDQGDYQAFTTCLDHNAQVAFRDKEGNTPLHHAAEHRRLEMIKDLLMHGADPATQNHDGLTPVVIAANNPDCLGIFMRAALPFRLVEERIMNNRVQEIFDDLATLDQHALQYNTTKDRLHTIAQRVGKYISLIAGIGFGGLTLKKVIHTWKNAGFKPARRQTVILTGITGIVCTLLYKYIPKAINRLFEPRYTRVISEQLGVDQYTVMHKIGSLREDYRNHRDQKHEQDRLYVRDRLADFNRFDRGGRHLQTERAQHKYAEAVAYFNR